jgi:GntR family transcriptional regulator
MTNNINQMKTLNKNSSIPVYYQLAKLIEKDILAGNFKPGEVLPPEHDFASRFGISRMTVRRAISELNIVGMVYSEKGKGTFVANPKLDDVEFELDNPSGENPSKEMNREIKLLGANIFRADETLAKKLIIPLKTKCLHFRLIVSVNNEPLIYENKYIIFSKHNPILETELNDPSLSNLVNSNGQLRAITGKRVFRASIVTEEEAVLLKVSINTPVFLVEQTIYDHEKKPIGWSKSVYRGDRYRLTSYTGWCLGDF